MKIFHRFLQDPDESFFLFGPRGTGKSTWADLVYAKALKIDFLAPDIYRSYSARPERLREAVKANPDKQTVFIDEVQKIPEILEVVHGLMEENRQLQFVMTGSSARKLKRSGVDLLAGRALLRTLHPFMASELGDNFDLEDSLKFGLLPVVVQSSKPYDTLSAYIALYLKEEVQQEGMVRNFTSPDIRQ